MPVIDFEKEENKQLLRNLFAYARGLYRKLYKDEVNWRGKSFEDYVYDAMLEHMEGTDKYDPKRGSLASHLKYNVIRQALTNDLPSAVKKKYAEYRKMTDEERELSTLTTPAELDRVDPDELMIVSLVINNIDSEHLFKEIEKEINGDAVVEQIYLAVVYDKYEFGDRAEICKDFGLSTDEFDNGKRRLFTILRRVFKKLDIEE